jgi:hypothetical protein
VRERTCSVGSCDGRAIARGWCHKHWQRWRKHGSPFWLRPSVEDRLWAGLRPDANGCWVWRGRRTGSDDSYGVLSDGTGKSEYVHRAAHRLWVGPIPSGWEVDHVAARGCRSPLCCRPRHLEAVTPAENRRRSDGLAAVNARKTHCQWGHSLARDNVRVSPAGHRKCIACERRQNARQRSAEWKAASPSYQRKLATTRRVPNRP